MGLGALHLYNIIARRQDLIDLSESIKIIAGWWHYGIVRLFAFLRLDMYPWQKEILVIVIVFGSAANVAAWRTERRTTIGLARDFYLRGDYLRSWEKASDPALLFSLLYLVAVLASIPYPLNWWFSAVVVTLGALSLIVVAIAIRSGADPQKWDGVVRALLGLQLVIVSWIFSVGKFYRQILKSSWYLLILLAADLVIRFVLEPLGPWPEIPRPPPT